MSTPTATAENSAETQIKLNRRQRRAAEEHFIGASKAEAYRRAYAVKANWDAQRIADNAYKLFKRPEVQAYLAQLAKDAEEQYSLRKHLVLSKLSAAATSNIQDLYDESGALIDICKLPRDVAATICSIEVEQRFEGRGESREHVGHLLKVKQIDPKGAAEVLGKMLGWIKEKVEHSGEIKTGGVLVVPATPSESDWEKSAGQQQSALTEKERAFNVNATPS